MHLQIGIIRAYQDGGLDEITRQEIAAHLASCPRCQKQAQSLQQRAAHAADRLARLNPPTSTPTPSAVSARMRLEEKIEWMEQQQEKEKIVVFKKIFSKPYRPAWVALAVVLILTMVMIIPPLRALANDFLGLFRVRQISIVEVDASQLRSQLGNSAEFEAILAENVTFEAGGDTLEVASLEEAVAQAGYPARLPQGMNASPSFSVTPAARVQFKVDLERVRALLEAMGQADLQLPASLDGATVTLDIPTTLTTHWGTCEFDSEEARAAGYDPDLPEKYPLLNCTTLIQLPSPSVSAPQGLDVNRLGEAYLQILGMSPKEAARFAKNIDWASTVVIPIPRYAATYREVSVDGVQGTLIQDATGNKDATYMLMWVKDGMVYALSGPGDASTALRLGNSLK